MRALPPLVAVLAVMLACEATPEDRAAYEASVAHDDSTARADYREFYEGVLAAASGVDAAGRRMTAAVESGDAVAAFRAAEDLENAAFNAWREVGDVDVPDSVPDTLRDDAEDARDAFQNAMLARQTAASAVQDALDGGGISALSGAQRANEAYQSRLISAAAGLVSVGLRLDSTFAEHIGTEGGRRGVDP